MVVKFGSINTDPLKTKGDSFYLKT